MKDEAQLSARLERGSEEAFRVLVDRYQERVLNTCLGFVPHRQDAEDLTQEVFLEVFRSVGAFRGEARLSTWIYRIAVTKCLEFRRSRQRQKRQAFFRSLIGMDSPEVQAVADAIDHPGIALENRERAQILFSHIDRLPEQQRIAFVLQQIEQLSQREIAQVMGNSEAAVESLLHRARRGLRNSLQGYYEQNLL